MELSLARLINRLVSKPDLVADINGNVEKALSLGGISPTVENKAAMSAALQMLGKPRRSEGIAGIDTALGWDGGDLLLPLTVTPSR